MLHVGRHAGGDTALWRWNGINPADAGPNCALSNNNQTVTKVNADAIENARALVGKASGKWMFEAFTPSGTAAASSGIGVVSGTRDITTAHVIGDHGSPSDSIGFFANGVCEYNSAVVFNSSPNMGWAGGVGTVCCDIDARLLWFFGSLGTGNWNNSGTANPATGVGGVPIAGSGALFPGMTLFRASSTPPGTLIFNFGYLPFSKPVPGYSAWR